MAANFEKMFKVGNNGELLILLPGGSYGAVVSYGDAGLVAGKDAIGGGVVQSPSDWNATSGVTRILNKPTIIGGSGDVALSRKVDVVANGQTVTLIVSGFGTRLRSMLSL